MKFSYQWIQELVPGLDLEAHDLEQLITVRTAECEGVERSGELLSKAQPARVLKAERIGETKLTKARIELPSGEQKTVVCGAPNCDSQMTAVWVDLARKTIQGVESDGMLVSAAELGVGRESEVILTYDPGLSLLRPDDVIDIDNKSLTHRPDLWGHVGMAREVAAITKRGLRDPVDMRALPGGSGSFEVRVLDRELCPRFSAVLFENVEVAPSPQWLQYRLISIGLNPINNIVDITNFVMAELAQPMHAFDRDKLRGDRLIVRRAYDRESLPALNGETYTLTPAMGVVADQASAVSLAGIIGGADSAIGPTTRNIVFEAANWNAPMIRRTSAALKLRTDASMRFEKAQDPANTVRALARAVELMRQICPEARVSSPLTDVYESPPARPIIVVSLQFIESKLGRDVEERQMREILERLGFEVHPAGRETFNVKVPTWRATKDISIPDDLAEEVGRMLGYDSIPAVAPWVQSSPPPIDTLNDWLRDLRALCAARGHTEVYNYSFLSDKQVADSQLIPTDLVRILNPIASDQNVLRPSLIPGLLANIELNAKRYAEFRLFEIGRAIHNMAPAKPLEIRHLGAVVFSAEGDGRLGLLELKGLAEAIVPGARFRPEDETLPYEHPARTATILAGTDAIGRLFEAHPNFTRGRAALLDLNLDRIFELREPLAKYKPVRRFPGSAFDLSVVVDARAHAADLERRIADLTGELLDQVTFDSEYQGPQIPAGMKSLTFRVTVCAADRTLASEEIGAARTRTIEGLRHAGIEVRA